jgi:hypothetical protein
MEQRRKINIPLPLMPSQQSQRSQNHQLQKTLAETLVQGMAQA